tara:strand:+ start:2300 stop:4147 length:1848 start_codon:yes stop_codon:yes gene_type:complete
MIANSSQGIVEMIQRKKDAYQDNPQALQQRYQQNKQLTDLLALQQLKTEKEAAARDIQLKMQQNPQTIAQQREQEVLGLIKQEQGRNLGKVTQQVGGVLGQRQKEAMQRRQRMGMAQGGIVGFQSGEIVDGEKAETISVADAIAELGEEAFNYIKENPAEAALQLGLIVVPGGLAVRGGLAALKAAGVTSKLKNLMRGKKPDFEITPKGTAVPTDRSGIISKSKELMPSGPIEAGKQLVPYGRGASMTRPTAALTAAGALGLGSLTGDKEVTDEEREDPGPYGPPLPPVKGTIPGVDTIDKDKLFNELQVTTPELKIGTARQDAAKGILTDIGLDKRVARDPDAVRKARMADVKEEMGLAGIQTRKQSQIDRLRTQQEQLAERDPFEAFIAGTVGAAQRGGPGGFAAGYIGKLSQQRAQQRQNLKDEFGIENELLDLEQTVLSKGIDSADKAVQVLSTEKQAYANIMSKASEGDISDAQEQANRVLDADVQNIKTKLDLLGQETDRAIASAELRGAALEDMQELLQKEVERRDELLSPVITALVNDAQSGYGDVESAVNRAGITKGFILQASGIFEREEDLLRRIEALGGDVSSQRSALAEQRKRVELMGQYLQQ